MLVILFLFCLRVIAGLDSQEAELNEIKNNNASSFTYLEPLDGEEITLDSAPLTEAERANTLQTLRNLIKTYQKENWKLKQVKFRLRKKCDANYARLVRIYNDLLSRIQRGAPLVTGLQNNITAATARESAYEITVKRANSFLEVLKLKRNAMVPIVQQLQAFDYRSCEYYGRQYGYLQNLQGENDLSTRSFGRIVKVRNENDVKKLIYEQRLTLLIVKRDQVLGEHRALKSSITYFSHICQLRLENMKLLIKDLENYPMAQGAQGLQEYLNNLLKKINQESLVLQRLWNQLQEIANEIFELQRKYDGLSNVVRCFTNLIGWHIDNEVDRFKEIITTIDYGDYSKLDEMQYPHALDESGVDVSDIPSKAEVEAANSTLEDQSNNSTNSSLDRGFEELPADASNTTTNSPLGATNAAFEELPVDESNTTTNSPLDAESAAFKEPSTGASNT